MQSILDLAYSSSLLSVTVIVPYQKKYSKGVIMKIMNENPILSGMYIYGCDYVKRLQHNVVFTNQSSINISKCGNISHKYFSPCLASITESISHNICLNKKICISFDGSIRNCPSFPISFGNIKKDSLKDIISNTKFKRIWDIKKDDIKVLCKDCEMRYICHDCRVFIKNKQYIYSQPEKCYYNPYIGKWQGEDDYITVEDFIADRIKENL